MRGGHRSPQAFLTFRYNTAPLPTKPTSPTEREVKNDVIFSPKDRRRFAPRPLLPADFQQSAEKKNKEEEEKKKKEKKMTVEEEEERRRRRR